MPDSVKVKICGLTDEAAARAAAAAKADYAGFVFYPPSPRHLSVGKAAQLKNALPDSVRSVAVLVDPDDELIKDIAQQIKPHALQLHGKETPERLNQIRALAPGCLLIKGISVKNSDDVAGAMRYADAADMFLFDAKPPAIFIPSPQRGEGVYLPGGNGLAFDWVLLKNRDFGKPWFLSGGLNPGNVREAVVSSGARMVDVSSGVERAPGVKDTGLIQEFVKAARA